MTVTVTWESVFCTVTASSSAGAHQRRDEGCSTQVFSTITACSATASTFTTTTTVGPTQTARPGCSPDKCGASCSAKREVLKRAVPRSTQPGVCQWAGPSNYADPNNFMVGESKLCASVALGDENSKIVSLPTTGKTSSQLVGFFDQPVSLAVPHLVGCTSIIVVSRKGAWASHIWELPVFRPEEEENEEPGMLEYALPGTENFSPDFPFSQQLAFFQDHALDKLRNTYDPPDENHEFGLGQLQNSATPEDQSWQGHVFDPDSEPQVFAFIPYVTIYDESDPNYNQVNPVNLPAAWDRPGAPNPRADENGDPFNDQIAGTLRSIFGDNDLPIQRVLYAPDVEEEDPFDADYKTSRGRALVQYQPADIGTCSSKANWRIWFEGQVDAPTQEKEWDPLGQRGGQAPAQLCGGQAVGGGLQKRQTCSISASFSSSTSRSPISTSSSILISSSISTSSRISSSSSIPSSSPTSISSPKSTSSPISTSSPKPTSTPISSSRISSSPIPPQTSTTPSTSSATQDPTTTSMPMSASVVVGGDGCETFFFFSSSAVLCT
ncbi:hypothetical protein GGR55DRAFT_677765 [Xylaria sp. FL0064]|nr:hypothetical protein GGR55DRAFT_677765 [Xylaria sp. FL0064]